MFLTTHLASWSKWSISSWISHINVQGHFSFNKLMDLPEVTFDTVLLENQAIQIHFPGGGHIKLAILVRYMSLTKNLYGKILCSYEKSGSLLCFSWFQLLNKQRLRWSTCFCSVSSRGVKTQINSQNCWNKCDNAGIVIISL